MPGVVPPDEEGDHGVRPGGARPGVGVPALVTVVVVLFAELAVRVVHGHLPQPSAWPSPELQKKYDQIVARAASGRPTGTVLVGDSMLDAAGDPTGLAAAGAPGAIYNASIAGETLPTIAEWTLKVVVPRLHPRVVVIGFSANELNPASLSQATGLGAYHASRAVRAAEGTGSVVDRLDASLRRWSYLYRYRTTLRLPFGAPPSGAFDPSLSGLGHDVAFAQQTYLEGGPAHVRAVVNGVVDALRGFSVGPQNVSLLSSLITSLRRQGVKVVLDVMPVTSDLVSFLPDGSADYQRALTAFRSIAQSTGATLEVHGIWPPSQFADPVHVNGSGTAHFSSDLAGVLRLVGGLS